MNMVIRGLTSTGKERLTPLPTISTGSTGQLHHGQSLPFNMKEWDNGVNDDDRRWQIRPTLVEMGAIVQVKHWAHDLENLNGVSQSMPSTKQFIREDFVSIIHSALAEAAIDPI